MKSFRTLKKHLAFTLACLSSCMIADFPLFAQQQKSLPPLAYNQGKLVYQADSLGNQIVDFSYAGYMAGEEEIPNVPVRVVVPEKKGDATLRIQSAIDYVSRLTPDEKGIRGAVLLEKGMYEIKAGLKINASGVILRGSGMGSDGTILFANSTSRETIITISGTDDRKWGDTILSTNQYVPVNTTRLTLAETKGLEAGDQVQIKRPSSSNWINDIHADHFGGGITALGWKPGTRDINWDRTIVSVDGNTINLDAPLTTAIDSRYGHAIITRYQWPGRIHHTGVENIRIRSAYDKENAKDEEHAWMAITMERVSDAWVRQVVFEHFAGSAVAVFETGKRVTVEDCKSLHPVSEIGGQRRNTFFTNGQQTLFQRCYAEYGYHDYAVGFTAAGPNAFVQCESHLPYSFSGAIDSWASGVLFDAVHIDGNALSYANRWQDGQGAGWTAANSVFWNCAAARIECFQPPTANNYAFGTWAEFVGDGYWGESNNHIDPLSLYYAQLKERLKGKGVKPVLLEINTSASSSPSVELAQQLTAAARQPAVLLSDYIDDASKRNPIPLQAYGAKTIDEIGVNKKISVTDAPALQVKNGWLVRGSQIQTGQRDDVQWWSGSSRPFALEKMKAHITRFVPGRIGHGLTDDLEEVTNRMKENNIIALEHNYALWYDRRRDDHERVRRMNGDVWPPFYEVPFARSGEGTAWDGLSKYNLTKYNTWYWSRLKQFADLADQKGLVLAYHHYFQHNILEAGAHYADFAWRTANNINNTGFPEPVPYAGDKRIFMAEHFYDVSHPVRRKLHSAYIRKCLENFAENTGVVHYISSEFTGPLHFVEFWLDTIREWEKETGKEVLIGLSATKDVQDAILSDKLRSQVVDIIDIRYWHYREDGSEYAPKGGLNLAPRQHARLVSPGRSSAKQVYRAVNEYKIKYPEKAVIYSASGYDQHGWAALMGGGSLPAVPKINAKELVTAAASMKPVQSKTEDQWMLANQNNECIIYSSKGSRVEIDLSKASGTFIVRKLDLTTGSLYSTGEVVTAGKVISVNVNNATPSVILVSRAS